MITVALFKSGPFNCLDYLYEGLEPPSIGSRVLVPFGKKTAIGMIIDTPTTTSCPPEKLKPCLDVLDHTPLFSTEHLVFLRKIAAYYHHPLEAVIAAALPCLCRKGKPLPLLSQHPTPLQKIEHTLNSAQQAAVETLSSNLHSFTPFLLEGITGSGKTTVYLELIAKLLSLQKQALVLVPEIALTPQTLKHFEARFGKDSVVAYHSKMTPTKRFQAFSRALSAEPLIMVGTRSAILLPFARLGGIIVDEEHDPSYKQQEGFHYSARDLALWRGHSNHIPVVLGSASPCLETLANTQRSHWKKVSLSTRFNQLPLPTLHIVDTRNHSPQKGLDPFTRKIVAETLAQGAHVLFFLNRRGFSPLWMCFECCYRIPCPFCSTALTYHQHHSSLRCHHCGYQQALIKNCPDCKSPLSPLGIGTQRLEEQLSLTFPEIPIIRIDSDSTRHKGALETQLSFGQEQGAKILVGTQLLAKGHNFPYLRLAVLLETDQALFSTDFRATERFGQMITQVSGRAGRFHEPGQVLIHTKFPTHPLLQCLCRQGYAPFAQQLLLERAQAGLPPYAYLTLLRAESLSETRAEAFLKQLKAALSPSDAALLLGPVAAPLTKRNRHYRWQVLVRTSKRVRMQEVLSKIDNLSKEIPRSIRFSMDVDPLDLY